MFEPDKDGVVARASASAMRRVFACLVLYGLGGLLIYVAVAAPPSPFWLIFLIGLGVCVLLLAERMRRATERVLELTTTELRDDQGRVLAQLADIKSVERGVFAMKPSNGFTLVLTKSSPRAWLPGLWWRAGRRVGVGGVVSSGPAKFMAEQIALRIAN